MPRRDDLDLLACPGCGEVVEADTAPTRCPHCGEELGSRAITPRRREAVPASGEREKDEWVPAPPPRPTAGQRTRWVFGVGLIVLAGAGLLGGLAEALETGNWQRLPVGGVGALLVGGAGVHLLDLRRRSERTAARVRHRALRPGERRDPAVDSQGLTARGEGLQGPDERGLAEAEAWGGEGPPEPSRRYTAWQQVRWWLGLALLLLSLLGTIGGVGRSAERGAWDEIPVGVGLVLLVFALPGVLLLCVGMRPRFIGRGRPSLRLPFWERARRPLGWGLLWLCAMSLLGNLGLYAERGDWRHLVYGIPGGLLLCGLPGWLLLRKQPGPGG